MSLFQIDGIDSSNNGIIRCIISSVVLYYLYFHYLYNILNEWFKYYVRIFPPLTHDNHSKILQIEKGILIE